MYGSGSGRIWLDKVQCYGFESDIRACSHGDWGVQSCDHSQDVAISCFSSPSSPGNNTQSTSIISLLVLSCIEETMVQNIY